MKVIKLVMLGLFVMLINSCSPIQVASDYDTAANFSTYKTYAFHQKGLDKLNLNDLDKRRMTAAISTELATKGMALTDETTADIVINILASSKEKIDINYYNDPYMGWYYYPWMDQFICESIYRRVIDN